MRKLLISVAMTALFAVPALAQPGHDDHDHGGGGAPQPHAAPAGGGHPDHGGGAPHPGLNRGPGGGAPHPAPAANPAYSRGPNGGGFNRPAQPSAPAYTRGPNGSGNFHGGPDGGHPAPGGNRPGAGGARHDFHAFGDFHQNFNASRRFHASGYRQPPGWYSHHWTYGETLPSLFWARDYWLTDYVDYALPPPPYGAVWVRVANDALLIDQDSGEIITVEYGVFY